MKSLAVLIVAGLASAAVAADRPSRLGPVLVPPALSQVTPTPLPESDQAYVPGSSMVVMPSPSAVTPTFAVYSNVKYKDQRNIHPCAVSKIVQIADPCNPCCLVNVEVCVPPCACECVKVSKCGTKVKLDYGKYEVELTSRRGYVVVDYDD